MDPHDFGNQFRPAEFSCYVKGCLQPSRTLGDFYLKKPEAAVDSVTGAPYFAGGFRHLPYVSAEPDVRIYEGLSEQDKFLVLASDGLWDFLSEEEVLNTLEPYFTKNNKEDQDVNLAQLLIDRIMQRVAREAHLDSVSDLKHIRPSARRKLFDDSAIIVIVL